MKLTLDEGVTRREALGAMGALMATTLLPRTSLAEPSRNLGSASKTLFWVASVTPCAKDLRFDPGAFRDILSWLKLGNSPLFRWTSASRSPRPP
jgi:hypothetical protein